MASRRSLRVPVLVAGIAAAVMAAAVPALASRPQSILNRGMYDKRYCEYLFIHSGPRVKSGPPSFYADVWNTFGLNDCPDELWKLSDPLALTKSMKGAIGVKLNGPRHWLIDHASITYDRNAKFKQGITKRFSSGLRMRRLTTGLVPTVGGKPGLPAYTETTVNRTTHFTFSRLHPLRVLISPKGKRYAMQAYSQIKDASMSESSLATLDQRLNLPQGWRYEVVPIERDLTLETVKRTTVLQDEYENTYQLIR